MKKLLSNLLLAMLSAVAFTACDDAEDTRYYEGYF